MRVFLIKIFLVLNPFLSGSGSVSKFGLDPERFFSAPGSGIRMRIRMIRIRNTAWNCLITIFGDLYLVVGKGRKAAAPEAGQAFEVLTAAGWETQLPQDLTHAQLPQDLTHAQ